MWCSRGWHLVAGLAPGVGVGEMVHAQAQLFIASAMSGQGWPMDRSIHLGMAWGRGGVLACMSMHRCCNQGNVSHCHMDVTAVRAGSCCRCGVELALFGVRRASESCSARSHAIRSETSITDDPSPWSASFSQGSNALTASFGIKQAVSRQVFRGIGDERRIGRDQTEDLSPSCPLEIGAGTQGSREICATACK